MPFSTSAFPHFCVYVCDGLYMVAPGPDLQCVVTTFDVEMSGNIYAHAYVS